MKAVLIYIILISCLTSTGQVGKLDLKVILVGADTTYPYYLDAWVKKDDSIITRIAITGSGSYHFGNFKEGVYNLELHDYRSRKLNIDSVRIIADSTSTLVISYPGVCKYLYPVNYKPTCPKNHSDGIVNILYGFPSKKMMRDANKDRIHLGGCIITSCDPKYYCQKHKLEF